jgi:DNA-binding LacI/PurR family transcriptional regulator
MAITLHDICRETGLSTATVSRVLNNSPLVKEATRKKVQAVMSELNYLPLPSARALAGKRTGSIGIISPYVGSGFFTDIMVGVDHLAAERGVHVMMSFAHGTGDEINLVTKFIQERRVDAIVLINIDLPGELLKGINKDIIPIISVDSPAIEYGLSSVSMDNKDGAYSMMKHLLEHGYRDIVLFTGPESSYDSGLRLEGCRIAAKEAGVSLPAKNIYSGSFVMESGRELMNTVLKRRKKLPDVIMALNDIMAFGAMAVLREAGLSVPDDIAIAGFDNFEAAPLVGLTTVSASLYDMGRCAADMALGAMGNMQEREVSHIIVPAKLVVRETCGCREHTGE